MATKKKQDEMVKTSLRLKKTTWTATRVLGIERGIDAQDIVQAALEQYLRAAKKRGGRK